MTDLLTTEAERQRVEETAKKSLGVVGVRRDLVLRLLSDLRTLETQLAQERTWRKQSDEVIAANEGEWALRDVKVLAPFYDDAIARHQSRQQAVKEG